MMRLSYEFMRLSHEFMRVSHIFQGVRSYESKGVEVSNCLLVDDHHTRNVVDSGPHGDPTKRIGVARPWDHLGLDAVLGLGHTLCVVHGLRLELCTMLASRSRHYEDLRPLRLQIVEGRHSTRRHEGSYESLSHFFEKRNK